MHCFFFVEASAFFSFFFCNSGPVFFSPSRAFRGLLRLTSSIVVVVSSSFSSSILLYSRVLILFFFLRRDPSVFFSFVHSFFILLRRVRSFYARTESRGKNRIRRIVGSGSVGIRTRIQIRTGRARPLHHEWCGASVPGAPVLTYSCRQRVCASARSARISFGKGKSRAGSKEQHNKKLNKNNSEKGKKETRNARLFVFCSAQMYLHTRRRRRRRRRRVGRE